MISGLLLPVKMKKFEESENLEIQNQWQNDESAVYKGSENL